MSDITEQMNLSNLSRELRFEELRKMREQMKESEEKWQDVSIKIHGFVNDNVCGVDVFIRDTRDKAKSFYTLLKKPCNFAEFVTFFLLLLFSRKI